MKCETSTFLSTNMTNQNLYDLAHETERFHGNPIRLQSPSTTLQHLLEMNNKDRETNFIYNIMDVRWMVEYEIVKRFKTGKISHEE